MERIKDAVIEVYKIDPATKSKVRPVSEARQAFCYFCRKYTKFTSRSIGEAVGITHGSVLYNAKAYGNLLMYEKIRGLAVEIEAKVMVYYPQQWSDRLLFRGYKELKIS